MYGLYKRDGIGCRPAVWDLRGEVIIVMIVWLMWYARYSVVHDNAPWLAGGITDN